MCVGVIVTYSVMLRSINDLLVTRHVESGGSGLYCHVTTSDDLWLMGRVGCVIVVYNVMLRLMEDPRVMGHVHWVPMAYSVMLRPIHNPCVMGHQHWMEVAYSAITLKPKPIRLNAITLKP